MCINCHRLYDINIPHVKYSQNERRGRRETSGDKNILISLSKIRKHCLVVALLLLGGIPLEHYQDVLGVWSNQHLVLLGGNPALMEGGAAEGAGAGAAEGAGAGEGAGI